MPQGKKTTRDRRANVHLFGQDGIFKQGVRSLLENTDFLLTGDYGDAGVLPALRTEENPVDVVISLDMSSPRIISALRARYAASRVVVVGRAEEEEDYAAAFAAGADGCILRNSSCESLLHSLRLVMSGVKLFPFSVPGGNVPSSPKALSGASLSVRELQVVRHLASGEPNKTIACNLNLAESTVKVHVKTVLRKMGAANRTQAAIMAISQGLAADPRRPALSKVHP